MIWAAASKSKLSFVPLQLPLALMRPLTIGIELPHHVAVQHPQNTNPRHHGVTATALQHQGLDLGFRSKVNNSVLAFFCQEADTTSITAR
jgi:hypothetical protein